ncbi:Rpn family recombination-promoting nuclease/putative transposase [Phocaeicola sartorii]|uniref:Rpn family recombination-promoting nuclease/putative transposase n=1 Tax=Phocaeicola sartorii TaxID=671267 RepID=UPI0025A9B538|nr:Rpn family recombination-promoting nuclease/putative transposase [Phocaeicola sartorii]
MTDKGKFLAGQFKPVTIQDDMMFGTVMADPEYCKPFLETILGVKIQKIEYPERQKAIGLMVSAKSIRMDVYVEDGEHTVYDVEMQTGRNRNLPKRSRYYSGLIDLNILAKGEDYNQLKKSLVIFICTFDPFGHDEYIYRCGEYYQLSDCSYHLLGDDAWKIFVNAKGHKGDVSEGFRFLMRYIMDGEAQDSYTQALEKKVALVNNDEEWKVSYMTWAIKLADERREAREEGREEGRKEGRKEGNISTLYGLYSDGDITLEKAAVKAGMSEQAFLEAAKKIAGI